VRRLEAAAAKAKVPLKKLGRVTSNRLVIGKLIDLPLEKVEVAWRGGLP
jgi:hypothetical protein